MRGRRRGHPRNTRAYTALGNPANAAYRGGTVGTIIIAHLDPHTLTPVGGLTHQSRQTVSAGAYYCRK